MKVLHISSSDTMGGAAQSAYRLHRALMDSGIESIFLAGEKQRFDDPTVISFKNGYFWRRILAIIDSWLLVAYPHRTKKFPFTNNSFPVIQIRRTIKKVQPDLLHLHWIGKGLLRLEDLQKINVPVVWTMHDNYPFTGGCHLVNDCTKYLTLCGSCPQLNSKRADDRSTTNFRRKKKLYAKVPVTFIVPSSWMEQMAKSSALLKNAKVLRIPNVIDGDAFFRGDKTAAKLSLGIDREDKVILFGAVDALADKNKGFALLIDALNALPYSTGIILFVFGADAPPHALTHKYPIHFKGFLKNVPDRRRLYTAADVVVVPSRVENLSNVILESMSCATPVVAFATGGNGDLIDHCENGYLANLNDIKSLGEGIQWVLEHKDYLSVSHAAERKIRTTFDRAIVTRKHVQAYKDIIL